MDPIRLKSLNPHVETVFNTEHDESTTIGAEVPDIEQSPSRAGPGSDPNPNPSSLPTHTSAGTQGETMVEPGDEPDHGESGSEAPRPKAPSETGGGSPPPDLALEPFVTELFQDVLRTYVRNLWALLLVLGLPVAPLVLLAQIPAIWPARKGVYLNGVLETAVDPLGTPVLGMTVALAVLGLLIAPLPLGGAVLFGTGALLGRRITVRAAWCGALRRYFTTLTWVLMLLVVVAGATVFALWLLFHEWPVITIGLLVLPPLVFLLLPLSVMLPTALLEGHGPFRGLAVAWRISRYRRRQHLVFVVASYGVSLLAGTVLERSLLRWTEMVEGDPMLVGITAIASLLAAPLSLLLLCATVLYSGNNVSYTVTYRPDYRRIYGDTEPPAIRYTVALPSDGSSPTRELDLARVDRQLPAHRSKAPRVRAHHLVTVPLVLAALFVPPLLGPVALVTNPFGLVELTTAPVRSVQGDDLLVEIAAIDDGVLVGTTRNDTTLEWCDPDCTTEFESQTPSRDSGVSVEEGLLLRTMWLEFKHGEPYEEGHYAPHPESGLYLAVCEDTMECDETDEGVFLRPFDGKHYDISSAAAPLPDGGLVVASHVRHDEDVVAGDTGGLRLHVCADTTCAEPHVPELPAALTVGGFLDEGAFLDVAGSPTGGFTVAAMNPTFGALSLVSCAENECADPHVTEVFGDQFRNETGGGFRSKYGTRVEYRSDGTPVAIYRDLRTGEARLVDCHDPVCSEFTDNAVTGPGWARPLPGLAIDSQDRPQLLTPDMAAEQLILLSCLDQGCTETVSTPLVDFGGEPLVTALALDDHDRPHMVWGARSPDEFGSSHLESLYLSCAEPYCGTEPTTP